MIKSPFPAFAMEKDFLFCGLRKHRIAKYSWSRILIVDFSGSVQRYTDAIPRLHSIHPLTTRESKWRYIVQKINLRDLYPDIYKTDSFLEVTDEAHAVFQADERAEAAYERKMYRYKAQYSLDCENGIENAVLQKPPTPEMLLEEKQLREQL